MWFFHCALLQSVPVFIIGSPLIERLHYNFCHQAFPLFLCQLVPERVLQPLVFKQRYKFCRKWGHYRAQSSLWSLHRQLTMWNSSVHFSSKTDCSIALGVRELNLNCSAVIACSLLFEKASAEHSTSIFLL